MFLEMLTQAGMVALLSIVVGLCPLGLGVLYAVQPTEQRLGLLRPVSLAAIFAGLCGMLSGFVSILRGIAVTASPIPFRTVALGSAEALVPLFITFGCLTVAWLCVAVGLRRQA
jgi:hypothetical protein